MEKKTVIKGLLAVSLLGGALWFGWQSQTNEEAGLKLYGSIDMRTVSVAFEEVGKITSLSVEEGMTVKAGELLATIDETTYRLERDRAAGAVAGAQARRDMTRTGSRTEEIRAAVAQLEAARSAADHALRQCRRQEALGMATSEEKRELACSQANVEAARVKETRERLSLLEAGYREEDKRAAEAELKTAEAALAIAEHRLANCRLSAPVDAVVRSRLKETGDMAGPQAPVFELAVNKPMWARVWIDEINLGKIHSGQSVLLTSDSFPQKAFKGHVGFISDVAEFTPRTVQTEALRTSLVYEVRVTVDDPSGELRLGMPVTVKLLD